MYSHKTVKYDNEGLDKCYRALLSAIALQAYYDLVDALRKRNNALEHHDTAKAAVHQLEADKLVEWFQDALEWGSKVTDAAEDEARHQATHANKNKRSYGKRDK